MEGLGRCEFILIASLVPTPACGARPLFSFPLLRKLLLLLLRRFGYTKRQTRGTSAILRFAGLSFQTPPLLLSFPSSHPLPLCLWVTSTTKYLRRATP